MAMMPIPANMNSAQAAELLAEARRASELLKALSHETRLMLLCILSEGEKSVSEMEEILDMPQAAVSQQLARLRIDGLVEARRDGRMIYYSISGKDVSSVVETLYDLFCKPVRPPGSKAVRK